MTLYTIIDFFISLFIIILKISQTQDDIITSSSSESSFLSNSAEEEKDLIQEKRNKRQDLLIGQENLGQLESLSSSQDDIIQQDEEDLTSTVVTKQQNIIDQEKIKEAMKDLKVNFTEEQISQRNQLNKKVSKINLIRQRKENELKRKYEKQQQAKNKQIMLMQQELQLQQQKMQQSQVKQEIKPYNQQYNQQNDQQLQSLQQLSPQQEIKTEQSPYSNLQGSQGTLPGSQDIPYPLPPQQPHYKMLNPNAFYEDEEPIKKVKKQIKTTSNFSKEDFNLVTGSPLPLASIIQNQLYFFLVNIQYPTNIQPENASYIDLLGKVFVQKGVQNSQNSQKFTKNSLTQNCLIRVKNLQKELFIELNQFALNKFLAENIDLNDDSVTEEEFYKKFGEIIQNPDTQIPVKFQQGDIWKSGMLNEENGRQIIADIKQTIAKVLNMDIKNIQARPTIRVQLQDSQQKRRLYLQILVPGNQQVSVGYLQQIKKQSKYITEIFFENSPIMSYIINNQLQVNQWYNIQNFKQENPNPTEDTFKKCKIKYVFTTDVRQKINKLTNDIEKPDYSKLYLNIKKTTDQHIICASCLYEYQNYKRFYFISNQTEEKMIEIADTTLDYINLQMQNNLGQFKNKYNNKYDLILKKIQNDKQCIKCLADIFAECQADIVIADSLRQEETQMINLIRKNVDTYSVSLLLNFYNFNEQKNNNLITRNTRLTMFSMGQILDFNKLVSELAPDDKELSLEYQARSNQICDETHPWINNEEIQLYLQSIKNQHFIINNQCEEVLMMSEISKQFNAIELFAQISNLTFMPLQETFIYGRAKRNAQLLNVVFSNMIFICPGNLHWSSKDQTISVKDENDQEGRHAQYEGGRVIDPERGFHTNCIIVLDYNSLYPSVIREYNICYTNIQDISQQGYGTPSYTKQIQQSDEYKQQHPFKSVLPKVVTYLLQTRKKVKNQIKQLTNSADPDEEQISTLNIMQLAFKLIANSMYGCLGFSNSFYQNLTLASKITELGRQALGIAEQVVVKKQLKIIYGDTDSIMIDSGIDLFNLRGKDKQQQFKQTKKQVLELANSITDEIASNFVYLRMGLDYIFLRQLLTNKKRYAAIKLLDNDQDKLEYKGLDLVRRDWCQISRDIQKQIIKRIMYGGETEGANDVIQYMENVNNQLQSQHDLDGLDWKYFKMTKMLNKAVEQYKDKKGMDHVICAEYMQQCDKQNVRAGQIIEYLIINREFAPKWLQDKYPEDKTLSVPFNYHEKIDQSRIPKIKVLAIDYYIKQQILPPVERITCFIDALKDGQISQIFGYESTYNDPQVEQNNLFQLDLEQMYRKCKPISINNAVWPESLSKQSDQYRKSNKVSESEKSQFLHPLDWIVAIGGPKYIAEYQQIVRRRVQDIQYKLQHNNIICSNQQCVYYQQSLEQFFSEMLEAKECPFCQQPISYQYNRQELLQELFYLIDIHNTKEILYQKQTNTREVTSNMQEEQLHYAENQLNNIVEIINKLRQIDNIGFYNIQETLQNVQKQQQENQQFNDLVTVE